MVVSQYLTEHIKICGGGVLKISHMCVHPLHLKLHFLTWLQLKVRCPDPPLSRNTSWGGLYWRQHYHHISLLSLRKRSDPKRQKIAVTKNTAVSGRWDTDKQAWRKLKLKLSSSRVTLWSDNLGSSPTAHCWGDSCTRAEECNHNSTQMSQSYDSFIPVRMTCRCEIS